MDFNEIERRAAQTIDLAASPRWMSRRAPQLTLHAIFSDFLRVPYLVCPWKDLPIERGSEGRTKIYYPGIYGLFRRKPRFWAPMSFRL